MNGPLNSLLRIGFIVAGQPVTLCRLIIAHLVSLLLLFSLTVTHSPTNLTENISVLIPTQPE